MTRLDRRMSTTVLSTAGALALAPYAADENPLLDLAQTLRAVFGDKPPSPRWFKYQTKRGLIPYFKIGGLVRYNPRHVRAALDLNCLVHTKQNRSRKGGA